MFEPIKHSAGQAARRAGLVTGAAVCMLVGAGFVTAAAWMTLDAAFDAVTAAMIIGGAYFGIALILIGVSRSDSGAQPAEPATTHPQVTSADGPALLNAFLGGMQAGSAARRGTRH
jgi:NADH:ubiquinone oxidoreductase subunit 6 (subunit J)